MQPENNLCVLGNFLYVAVNHLNGAMLYGKKIHVTLSKHTQVQMPQPGSNMSALVGLIIALPGGNCCSCVNAHFVFTSLQEDGLTEDYTNSPLHRFKVSKFLFARWMQHFKNRTW